MIYLSWIFWKSLEMYSCFWSINRSFTLSFPNKMNFTILVIYYPLLRNFKNYKEQMCCVCSSKFIFNFWDLVKVSLEIILLNNIHDFKSSDLHSSLKSIYIYNYWHEKPYHCWSIQTCKSPCDLMHDQSSYEVSTLNISFNLYLISFIRHS